MIYRSLIPRDSAAHCDHDYVYATFRQLAIIIIIEIVLEAHKHIHTRKIGKKKKKKGKKIKNTIGCVNPF